MAQINHVFGKSLEFSTTVRNGEIQSQELVSSNDDCIISFKLDKNFLCPKVLRDLANQIDAEKVIRLALASQEQASEYIKTAKESGVITSGLFESSKTAAYLAIAEYAANVDGFTLYDSRATPVPVSEVIPGYRLLDDDLEEEDDEDLDDYDEDDDEYEKVYDCQCDICRAYNELDDEDDEDEDDE